MDYQQTVEDSRSALERLMSHVPGYSGYKEKENRRAADKLLRDHLAGQLGAQRRQLADLQRQLLDSGGLRMMDDLDRAVTKVQKLADAVRTASYGYAGLFDAVTVKEEQLDQLYDFDDSMLAHVSAIQDSIDALSEAIDADGDVKEAIKSVVTTAEEANVRWRQRDDVLSDIV